jgi:hypothetical protein
MTVKLVKYDAACRQSQPPSGWSDVSIAMPGLR